MYDDENEKINRINGESADGMHPEAEGAFNGDEERTISQDEPQIVDEVEKEKIRPKKMSLYAEYATSIYPKTNTVVVKNMENDTQQVHRMAEDIPESLHNTEGTANTNVPIRDTYYTETVKEKKAKKETSFKKFIAACLVISLFGGTGIGASYAVMQNFVLGQDAPTSNEVSQTEKVTPSAQPVSSTNGTMTAVDVIDKVYPSVVNINMQVSGTTNYYGFSVPYEGSGSGSGVIFDMDEDYVYIVTNNHVVDSATGLSISVTGAENIAATVVGTDAANDLAVIKALKADFKAAGVDNIVAAKFGNSDNIKVGQSVLAIGNALGEGKSATGGMISMLNKAIEVDGISLNVLQTSAAINPGNSGGALVNYQGEIIGINTAKTSTSVAEAMGYAIPSNTVKKIMEELEVNGTMPQPYLGIMGSDITDDIADMYKLPVGVLVRQVMDGGGAAMAGLKEGDVIVSFDGKSIMNMESLISTLKEQEVGTTVEMDIIRDAKTSMTLNVKILDSNNIK